MSSLEWYKRSHNHGRGGLVIVPRTNDELDVILIETHTHIVQALLLGYSKTCENDKPNLPYNQQIMTMSKRLALLSSLLNAEETAEITYNFIAYHLWRVEKYVCAICAYRYGARHEPTDPIYRNESFKVQAQHAVERCISMLEKESEDGKDWTAEKEEPHMPSVATRARALLRQAEQEEQNY